MTPQEAWEKRYPTEPWVHVYTHVKDQWMAAWTIASAMHIADERERCAKLCDEWARICDSGKRHGAKVGAQECAKLIRTVDDADAA